MKNKVKVIKKQKCEVCGAEVKNLKKHMAYKHQDGDLPPERLKKTDPPLVIQDDAPFTKEDLLQSHTKAKPDDENDDEITYQCDSCQTVVTKEMKECPNCKRPLLWGEL